MAFFVSRISSNGPSTVLPLMTSLILRISSSFPSIARDELMERRRLVLLSLDSIPLLATPLHDSRSESSLLISSRIVGLMSNSGMSSTITKA